MNPTVEVNTLFMPQPKQDVTPASEPEPAPFGFVTAERLIGLGIVANALFWCGLLVPFNANNLPIVANLHAFVTMIGFGLALGGLVAVILMAIHEFDKRLFSPHLIAGSLHFSVVATSVTLLIAASMRGWLFS